MGEAERLDELRDRLRATQEAAERLADSASRPKPPPAGWDVPRAADETNAELQALVALIGTLRDVLPPELREQLQEVVRQVLLLVRAILDWWIERLDEPPTRGDDPPVEDVPID